MTERKLTNDKRTNGNIRKKNSERQTNNSYYTTHGLKNYSQKDVWSEQVAGKSVYAV